MPLPVVFDLTRLLRWFAERPEAAEHLDEASRVAKAIREYRAPAYIVQQDDEAVLRDVFDRMNNYGHRLSRAEVFTALHSGKTRSGGRPRTFSEIAEHLDAGSGFGVIDDDTILRAFLARRGADVARDIRAELDSGRGARDFSDEGPEAAHEGATRALELVIGFLQNDARVPHLAFLPYRYLLVALARFFAHYPEPAQRNRDLLRRWFWRAAVGGPALSRGVYTSTMRTLAGAIVRDDETGSVQALLAIVAAAPDRSFELPPRYKSTMAEVRFVLAAMWDLGPRSPSTGEAYTRSMLASTLADRTTASDALELFVRRAPRAEGKLANRVFLLGDDAVGRPQALFTEGLFRSHADRQPLLTSHVLDAELVSHLESADWASFFSRRRARLDEVTRGFLERMTEDTFEDTPPLDVLELDEPEDLGAGG